MRRLAASALILCLAVAGAAGPVAGGKTVVDCGTGDSLQAAIEASSPGDKILASGHCHGLVRVDGNKRLTIRGVDDAVLDGTGSDTYALWVSFSSEVALENLKVVGGDRGAIQSNRRLVLDKVNVAGSGGCGVHGGNTISIHRSVIENNGECGVAISGPTSRLTISNSIVSDHQVSGTLGAGVQVRNGAHLECSHSKIIRNRTTNPSGGGVYVDAASTVSWDQCKVRNNAPTDCVGC